MFKNYSNIVIGAVYLDRKYISNYYLTLIFLNILLLFGDFDLSNIFWKPKYQPNIGYKHESRSYRKFICIIFGLTQIHPMLVRNTNYSSDCTFTNIESIILQATDKTQGMFMLHIHLESLPYLQYKFLKRFRMRLLYDSKNAGYSLVKKLDEVN